MSHYQRFRNPNPLIVKRNFRRELETLRRRRCVSV